MQSHYFMSNSLGGCWGVLASKGKADSESGMYFWQKTDGRPIPDLRLLLPRGQE